MNFTEKKQNFKIVKDSQGKDQLLIDETGRVPGYLFEFENGAQDAYVIHSFYGNIFQIDGAVTWKKFTRNNASSNFREIEMDESSMPTFQGKSFIVNSRVLISNKFICNQIGKEIDIETGAQTIETENNIDFAKDSDGNYIPKPGHFLMGNFLYDNGIKQAIINPIFTVIDYRLANKD